MHRAQRGQALLVVLAFTAAFLLVVWAALALASAAFLGLGAVRADTRTTYALDAGLAYAMQLIDDKNGNGCNAPGATNLALAYASGTITVNTRIRKGSQCHGNGATWNITITATGTNRTLTALVTENNNSSVVTWESIQ
jgi:type II secretory pathway component PulK